MYYLQFPFYAILQATVNPYGRHIPEDDTLLNHRCENLKSRQDEFFYPNLPSIQSHTI
jgi:hypothetical protein